MVPPGTYDELVIMNKKVRLQGWGAPSTVHQRGQGPAEKLHAWRSKVNQLLAAGGFDLLPGQSAASTRPTTSPACSTRRKAPASWWWPRPAAARRSSTPATRASTASPSPVSDNGGGIFVNGYADYLEISNNRIIGNYGIYGGGIRLGHPNLLDPGVVPANDGWFGGYTNAQNNNVRIHHNHITQNGSARRRGRRHRRCTPAATTTR